MMNQDRSIQLFVQQEQLLAELYSSFSIKFVKYKLFWNDLARQKTQHAKLIKNLYTASGTNFRLFDEKRINTKILEPSIIAIGKINKKAKAKDFDMMDALANCFAYERTLLEREIYSRVNGLTGQSIQLMQFLTQETKRNLIRIQQLRRAVKAESSAIKPKITQSIPIKQEKPKVRSHLYWPV